MKINNERNKQRVKKYKTDFTMANNDIPKIKQNHVLKYTERVFNEKTEAYEYKTKEINYKLDWEDTMQLLESNEELVQNKKVRV